MGKNRKPPSDRPGNDPLAAVPVIGEGVESRKDSQGLVQIRACAAPKTATAAFLNRLGLQRCVRVDLDALGSIFWDQIDGARTLRDIAGIVCERTGQTKLECEKAIILFTRSLMLKRLIALAVPELPDDRT